MHTIYRDYKNVISKFVTVMLHKTTDGTLTSRLYMMYFKNSKSAKVVSGFVGLATLAMMMGPVAASAAMLSASQVSAIVSLLSSFGADAGTIANVQASLTGQPTTGTTGTVSSGGYNFTTDLTVGSKGAGVTALQNILVAKGHLVMPVGVAFGTFGAATKAAVIKWQMSAGITPASGLVGPKSRAALNAASGISTTGTGMGSGTVSTGTVTAGTGIVATLDASSPLNQTLITPQGVATLGVFRIANGGSSAVKVTMLKFKRTGISSDSTVNNVYLYSGSTRLTDSSSISQGMVNFSDAAGLITVPALSSVVVAVRGDIASGANGQTLGLMMTDATTDAGMVSGLPVSGAASTFATAPSGMATADFTGSFSPSSGSIDPQNDYVVWQKNLQIGNRDAHINSIRFQQIGSVYATDITNFRLMIDGTQVGTSVTQADGNRFVSFAFATPVTVKAGNHTVKILADVVGGSGRNFNFSLRRVVDVELVDSQLGVVITPTVATGAFTTTGMQSTTAVSINPGSLTVTKDTSSPSGNIVLNGSNVTLAKFKFRAQGEELKVENLLVTFHSSNQSFTKIRSGAVYADGVQIGSTQDIASTTAGTQFNLGSSLILAAGKDVVVEVRGDVFDNDGTNNATAGDTVTVNLLASTGNVYQRASLGYIGNAAIDGNSLTVASGSLALTQYSAYANQTVTVPQSAYKIGDFRLTTGNTEGVNVDTITLSLPNNGVTNIVPSDLTNVYVVYGSKTSTTKASGSTGNQTFSINEIVAANSTMNFAVYANINASPVSGSTTVATLTVSGTSQSSGQAVSSAAVGGQTVTVGSGTIASAVDASTPVSANVVANSMPKVASFKFTGTNDAFTVDELTAKLTGTAGAAAVSEIIFKDGATEIARQPVGLINGIYTATSSGLSLAVPYNSTKIIDAYVNLGGIGTGFSTTSVNIGVTLDGFEYQNSNGVKTRDYTDRTGNPFYAFKTKPTITNVALPTSVLSAGTQSVAKFTITADAGGTVSWKKIRLNVASSTGVTAGTWTIYDTANESQALSSVSASTTVNGVVDFVSTIDQEVSGSKTYVVKATLAGNIVAGASFSVNIPTGAAAYVSPVANGVVATAASFVWSDESQLGHTVDTNDWFNDYLVKNIPTDSQTMTK
jgi:hypothetical protein